MNKVQQKWIMKGLEAIKSQILRAKTKDAGDAEMSELRDKQLVEVNSVINDVMSKELFNEQTKPGK